MRDVFTRMPRGAFQFNLTVICLDKPALRTATTSGRDIQTLHESDWATWIPPIGIFPALYINL